MAWPLHQIGTAVPQVVPFHLGLIGARLCEGGIPEGKRPAHVERPGDIRRAVRLADRLDVVHEVVVERADVVIGHLGVGWMRHGRIKPGTICPYPPAHRIVEVGQGVVADPGLLVRRDIGCVDRTERRAHGQSTGKRFSALRGMAGDAIGETGNIFAPLQRAGCRPRLSVEWGARHMGREPGASGTHDSDDCNKETKTFQAGAHPSKEERACAGMTGTGEFLFGAWLKTGFPRGSDAAAK